MLERYASRLLKDHLRAHAGTRASSCAEAEGALLFLDIAGSTAMSEQFAAEGAKGAERLAGILNLYFGDVFGLIADYGGDTVRIDGDAVLALWREEPGAEPAVRRAARAALALRDGFVDWRPGLGVRMRHRLALGIGTVTAASIRLPGQRSFFVMFGDAVRAATATSQGTEPGDIALAPGVAAALGDQAQLRQSADGRPYLAGLQPVGPRPGLAAGAESSTAGDCPLEDFVPRILVDRARAGQSEWLAEFRMLTMVYVHLAGMDARGPGTLQRLDGAVRTVADAVRPVGVAPTELVIGDKGAVLVVACGLPPAARENNAVRALESATRIRVALAQVDIPCSIGVATGRAFCGDVGSATRREYLVTGPVMYYAARLMQAADGGVLVDAATAGAAGEYFSFSPPESLLVKGRAEPLQVHRSSEARRFPGPSLPAGRAVHGRAEEERRLLAQLDLGRVAANRVAAITAEAGAGKSLLLARVEAAARARGSRVLSAATSPVEMLSPYFVWRTLLPQLLCAEEGAAADAARLRTCLFEALRGGPLAAKAALVEDILPLDLPDQGIAAEISGAARVAGIEDVVVGLARHAAGSQPLVLLVDDVHWLDDPSAGLLQALARQVPGVLVVLASRPLGADCGPHVRQLHGTASLQLPLSRLQPEAIARIVCDALGVRSIPARLAEFVDARSEGLPLHAEQLALSLRDQQMVEISEGRCRVVVSDLPAAHPGHKVEDVIVSRIDTLDARQQLALKVASAIGRVFDLETLAHVHPVAADRPRLRQILEALVDAGLLERRGEPGGSYAFRHVIIRDVTHELVVHEKRAELHRRIAAHIEQRHAGDLAEHVARLAEHLEVGGRPQEAIAYRFQAAQAALRRYANHDALTHLDRIERLAAACGLALPVAQQARMAAVRADACHALSRFVEAGRHYVACAQASGIAMPAGRLAVAAATAQELVRQLLHRCGIVRRPAGAQARDRDRLAAHIHARVAEQAYFAGDALRIMHGTLASLNRAERVRSTQEMIEGYGALAIGLGTAGLHGAARFYRDRSLARAEQAGTLEGRGIAHLFAAVYSFQAGDWDAALAHCRRGAAVCRETGDRFRHQSCVVVEAYTQFILGRYAAARALLDSFGADTVEVENAPVRAWIFCGRALLDMVQGASAATVLANLGAAREGPLHRAETLLCDGLEVAARMYAGEEEAALQAARRALASMQESAPTMGIALVSIDACAEFFIARAETGAEGPDAAQRLRSARAACQAALGYAATTRIFAPRALLLRARMALLRRDAGHARYCAQRALAQAQQLREPLEQALAHLALAGMVAGGDASRHRSEAAALLQQLGVAPGFLAMQVRTPGPPQLALQAAPTA